MPRALLVAAVVAVLALATTAHAVLPSGNVVANPGAEDGPGSTDSTTINPPPGWTTTPGSGQLTAIQYGTGGYPGTDVSGSIDGGRNFFSGGTSAVSSAEQVIDLSAAAPEIDTGELQLNLSAYIGGFLNQQDEAQVNATLESSPGVSTAQVQVGPVTPADRGNSTALLPRTASVAVPPGTRSLRVRLTATRSEGSANDGYADNIVATLTQGAPLPAPTQGQTANAEVVQGTVLVKRKGTKGFVQLESAEQIPVGSVLDTTNGTIELITEGGNGQPQQGEFGGGRFVVQQSTRSPLTTLSLTGGGLGKACGRRLPRGGSPKVRAAARRRSLLSNARGRFRTRGRNSTATVRGTRWRTIDKCKGTVTAVQEGTVVVRDLRLRKNRVLTAGQRYLAKAPKRKRG